MIKIDFKDLSNENIETLLSFGKRADTLWHQGKCDDIALHHIINAISTNKFGFEDTQDAEEKFNNITQISFDINVIVCEEKGDLSEC